jgi:hypothetical protein
VQIGAGVQADRPARAGEKARIGGLVPGALGAGHRVAADEARAVGVAEHLQDRHLDRADVGDGGVGVDRQVVERGGQRGQRHREDDDAGQLPGDLHPARGGGVARGGVDVPPGDRPPAGRQRRGERAAELPEADDADRRRGHRRDGEGGAHAGSPTESHGRPVRNTRASAVATSRPSWAVASIR